MGSSLFVYIFSGAKIGLNLLVSLNIGPNICFFLHFENIFFQIFKNFRVRCFAREGAVALKTELLWGGLEDLIRTI